MLALRQNINLGFIALVFLLMPLLAHAGGLGLAPAVSITGIICLVTVIRGSLRDFPLWGWAFAAFLIWAVLSSLWSPYEDSQTLTNPMKLLLGGGLYLAFDQGVRHASIKAPIILHRLVTGAFVLGLVLLLVDLIFPYVLTYAADPLNPGENPDKKTGDIIMNLGHAIAVYALMMSFLPSMWKRGRGEILILLLLVILLFITGVRNGFEAGSLAVLASALAFIAAKKFPRFALSGLTFLAVLLVIGAPLIGFLARLASDDMLARLPFSWEHRLGMWDYTLGEIAQAPLWGHGFDAVRTFNETYMVRGYELPYVSLHPHSAGLHIWVETGFVGAVLAALTLIFLGRAALSAVISRSELGPPLAGFAAAAIVISTVTYGVWQEWWWASLMLAVSLRHLISARN